MSKLFDQAVEAVRRLPPKSQDEIARAMIEWASDDGEPEPIDASHVSAVLEGLSQMRRGEYASDEEVQAAFRRFER